MSNRIASANGVYIVNLNWGYQIIDEKTNSVLFAVRDSIGGPVRSEQCSDNARRLYEVSVGLFAGVDSLPQRNFLWKLFHMTPSSDGWYAATTLNWTVAQALKRRGKIECRGGNEVRITQPYRTRIEAAEYLRA